MNSIIMGDSEPYDEVDVSDWDRAEVEELGTKPKRWLSRPDTGDRWLMKYATTSRPAGQQEYRKGDDWAERIAYGIAELLGIPAAPVELAFETSDSNKRFGTICQSVLREEESLVNGDELMGERGIRVSRKNRGLYTVEAVFKSLEGIRPPRAMAKDLSTWEVFVGYLALDALIGNTDRHEENWSAIKSTQPDPQLRLSPTFDHASSLGFQLSDQDKEGRLASRDRNRTPEGYADRAKTTFAGRPHPFEALGQALALAHSTALGHWLGSVRHVDDLIAPIWAVPEERMSVSARTFAERMMRHNWSRLASLAQLS